MDKIRIKFRKKQGVLYQGIPTFVTRIYPLVSGSMYEIDCAEGLFSEFELEAYDRPKTKGVP